MVNTTPIMTTKITMKTEGVVGMAEEGEAIEAAVAVAEAARITITMIEKMGMKMDIMIEIIEIIERIDVKNTPTKVIKKMGKSLNKMNNLYKNKKR